jgi:hypothetical protein
MSYVKGRSGNPNGRPRGIVDRRAAGFGPICSDARRRRILEKLLKQAEAGDAEALKLVVPRLVPALKPIAAQVRIDVDPTLPPDRQVAGILEQMRDGRLSVEDAASLIGALTRQAELDRYGVLADAVAGLMISAGRQLPPELRMRRIAPSETQSTETAAGKEP